MFEFKRTTQNNDDDTDEIIEDWWDGTRHLEDEYD